MNSNIQFVVEAMTYPDRFTQEQLKANKNKAYIQAVHATTRIDEDPHNCEVTVAAYNVSYAVATKPNEKEHADKDELLKQYFELTNESIETYTENL